MRKVILQMSISIDGVAAAPMNGAAQGGVPRTLTEAPWETSRIAGGDLTEEIAALKREPGGDILAWGGASFAQSLIAANLVDEYRIVVNPVIAGEGLSIFGPFPGPVDVRLTEAQAFETGAVLHVYSDPHQREAA